MLTYYGEMLCIDKTNQVRKDSKQEFFGQLLVDEAALILPTSIVLKHL